MSDFEKLMGELQQLATDQGELAKALPADDGKDEAKIQAAAAEGGLDGGEGGGEAAAGAGGEGGEGGDADDKGKGDPMAKSFQITLDDGTVIEAMDGTEMVKALGNRLSSTETVMAKALGDTLALVKGQADMIKSLGDQIKKLSNEGRGRKAVVSVVEKPGPAADTMAKSQQPEGISPNQFFAKAFEAQKAGRISGTDIAVAESCLNRGEQIPANIVQRVMA